MPTPNSQVDFMRQEGLVSPDKFRGMRFNLIGAGGIGSPTAMFLAKMGVPEMLIIDDDEVSRHNLPNQLTFSPGDVGETKVSAIKQSLASLCPWTRVTTISQKFEGQIPLRGVVICGVDSMAARRVVWNSVRGNPDIRYYIEARTGAEFMRIYALDPNDPKMGHWYESTLYDDAGALAAPCTARAIIYSSAIVGALITRQVGKFANGVRAEAEEAETLFDLTSMQLMVTYKSQILARS